MISTTTTTTAVAPPAPGTLAAAQKLCRDTYTAWKEVVFDFDDVINDVIILDPVVVDDISKAGLTKKVADQLAHYTELKTLAARLNAVTTPTGAAWDSLSADDQTSWHILNGSRGIFAVSQERVETFYDQLYWGVQSAIIAETSFYGVAAEISSWLNNAVDDVEAQQPNTMCGTGGA